MSAGAKPFVFLAGRPTAERAADSVRTWLGDYGRSVWCAAPRTPSMTFVIWVLPDTVLEFRMGEKEYEENDRRCIASEAILGFPAVVS
jgi:hypothetical protein